MAHNSLMDLSSRNNSRQIFSFSSSRVFSRRCDLPFSSSSSLHSLRYLSFLVPTMTIGTSGDVLEIECKTVVKDACLGRAASALMQILCGVCSDQSETHLLLANRVLKFYQMACKFSRAIEFLDRSLRKLWNSLISVSLPVWKPLESWMMMPGYWSFSKPFFIS